MKRAVFFPHIPAAALSLLATAALCIPATQADDAQRTWRADGTIFLGGQDAGRYHEETVREKGQVLDTVEQNVVMNRLGAKVEIRSREIDTQDAGGRLLGGHFESSSSKTTMTTDLTVKGHTLHLTLTSGGKSYPRELAFTGELLGPEGQRMRLKQLRKGKPQQFQSFVSELGTVTQITVVPQGQETLQIDGALLNTVKAEYRIGGYPEASTIWVDAAGYTVRILQETPFGAMEIRKGRVPVTEAAGATLPAESYENTLALSNIRLPHPRELQRVTLEISAREAAGIQWPDLTSSTQRVLKQTPQSLVLEVSQTVPGAYRDGTMADKYLAPNALLQSDDEQVRQIATRAKGEERDPWKIALALQRWVNQNMHFDAGIAVAPATEVARDRHGTCVGYAVLLASLARAEHIPSRLVMGYVYETGIWGGHAWVEVLIDDQWRALDAAEYSPGVADAARIAVIREEGGSGTIEGMGELARLFAKVGIRTLSYRHADRTVEVPATATDHTIKGNTYANPWLGLTVVKPSQATFTGTEVHWPAPPSLVTVTQGDTQVSVMYVHTDPAASAQDLLTRLMGGAPVTPQRWQSMPALRARAANKEALVTTQGDMAWVLLAEGPAAHERLESLLPGISIAQGS